MAIGPILLAPERIRDDADYRPAMHYETRTGADEDLTTKVAACELSEVGSETTIDRRTDGVGETEWITDGTDGDVEFVFLQADLAALVADGLARNYDIAYFVEDGSERRKVAYGRVTLTPKVT